MTYAIPYNSYDQRQRVLCQFETEQPLSEEEKNKISSGVLEALMVASNKNWFTSLWVIPKYLKSLGYVLANSDSKIGAYYLGNKDGVHQYLGCGMWMREYVQIL
jgi:hypothetical protein